MHNYLQKILAEKTRVVERLKERQQAFLLPELNQIMNGVISKKNKPRLNEVLNDKNLQVIAEIKRRSPSKPHLSAIADPIALAQCYVDGGAGVLSILTDEMGFYGRNEDLKQVADFFRQQPIIILRKDFIIDPIQIAESVMIGADVILLIAGILGEKTELFFNAAKQYGLDVLIEVHDESELEFALDFGADVIGINNRNLKTFEVDQENALRLIEKIPSQYACVAESGIHNIELAKKYANSGFTAVLIGEALVTHRHPDQLIADLRRIPCRVH